MTSEQYLKPHGLAQWLLTAALVLPMGCAAPLQSAASLPAEQIEVAFSPEAGAEDLVLKILDASRSEIRLAGYSFTSPNVVRSLLAAKQRGVDVRVLVDDHGNRGRSNVAALNLVVNAGIPTRTISTYAIHHDKYIVVDRQHTETGSFNYSQAAARSNSENVIVIWSSPAVASKYLAHWTQRWSQGLEVKSAF
jgi:phosphatidylserine/phosphatidylglycerophosphate/cardiolipin synthase-like enzyme